jgi:hypothetical protein
MLRPLSSIDPGANALRAIRELFGPENWVGECLRSIITTAVAVGPRELAADPEQVQGIVEDHLQQLAFNAEVANLMTEHFPELLERKDWIKTTVAEHALSRPAAKVRP